MKIFLLLSLFFACAPTPCSEPTAPRTEPVTAVPDAPFRAPRVGSAGAGEIYRFETEDAACYVWTWGVNNTGGISCVSKAPKAVETSSPTPKAAP